MKKKILGKTNLKVSNLGLGIGGILGMKIFNEEKALNLIHKSIDNGINFFDTGSSYSNGNAELRLGKALTSRDLESLVISTKGGTVLSKSKRAFKNFTRKSLFTNLNKSLKSLRIEKIDLFQLHSPRIHDLNDDVYDTILRMKEDGKILHCGVSCDGAVLKKAIDSGVFDTVMCTYNIIDYRSETLINEAKSKNIGTIIKSPLAHVVFSNKIYKINDISSLWYFLRILKNFKSKLIKSYKFRFLNNIEGFSSAEIALNFVTRNKNIDLVMIGTTKVEHLLENLNSLEKNYPDYIIEKIRDIQLSTKKPHKNNISRFSKIF